MGYGETILIPRSPHEKLLPLSWSENNDNGLNVLVTDKTRKELNKDSY